MWILFCALLVSVTGPYGDEPWCIDIALLFDCPVVVGCCVCCLSCPVRVEVMYCCSAMPYVPGCLGGGNFAPLLTDKSALRIYQFVRGHLARPSEAGQILLKHASLSL